MSISEARTKGVTAGTSITQTEMSTAGSYSSLEIGQSRTIGTYDVSNESESEDPAAEIGIDLEKSSGVSVHGVSAKTSASAGVTLSVSRGKTHGISHTDSVLNSISRNLTYGINSSKSSGSSSGKSKSQTITEALGLKGQRSEKIGHSESVDFAHMKALTETLGNSQAVTLNIQNKSLINTLKRLDKQLERLDKCESIGMWDFAAYFLGESAAEAETAASIYRSLISGNQSGLEIAAINTWTDWDTVEKISQYLIHFLHPVFLYEFKNSLVPRPLFVDATALASTNELAIQLGLPRKSVKGLPVVEHAAFAQEVLTYDKENENKHYIALGEIKHLGRATNTSVSLELQSLSMHTLIAGSAGAGKGIAEHKILSQLKKYNVHFLAIEAAKREYKNVFGEDDRVSVYGTNPLQTGLLCLNPFSFPEKIHICEHLDRLIGVFNICWPLDAGMSAILKDAIERSYVSAGWDLKKSKNMHAERSFPDFIDVFRQIDERMEQSQDSNDISIILRSLTNGINGLMFTSDELSANELFDRDVIVDLSRISSSEIKTLIMGLLVMKLQEYRIASFNGSNVPLKHVTVLEEAHYLLKHTSIEQDVERSDLLGKSVEMLSNAISEMRDYGEGFIIADQSPGMLDTAVIRNTDTKIIMRLPEYSDRLLVGRASGLNDEQVIELAKLNKDEAVVYQSGWLEPVLCKIN